mgnify:CR=1 FL=1
MSKIELLNKKVFENLKHVSPVGGSLDSYVNGGAHPPRHANVDFKEIEQMKEDRNKDVSNDKPDK